MNESDFIFMLLKIFELIFQNDNADRNGRVEMNTTAVINSNSAKSTRSTEEKITPQKFKLLGCSLSYSFVLASLASSFEYGSHYGPYVTIFPAYYA